MAAEDAPTAGELLQEAMKAMQEKRHDDAIASMYMYLGEVDESKAPRVVAIAQDIRFKLGSLLITQKRLDEAAAVLQDYIDHPLANKPRQAMKMLTTCYFETEAYEECVTAVTNALYYNENPVVLSQVTTKKKGDDEDEEDYSKEKVEPEEEYTQDELTTLHMTLAESYYNIEKWAECIDPFSYVIAYTPNEQRKGYAIMQVINALIEIPDFARITEWIPQLYRTEARYDIRVNLALMNAAAALYDAREYDSALPLYRMILPRDELVTFQEGKMRNLRIAAGLPPEMGAEISEDDLLLFGADDTSEASTEEKNADTGLLEDKPKEIIELENLIFALKDLPPYELDIQYRMADLYKTVERFWESLKFFDIVFAVDPASEVGERSIYEMVDMLLKNLDDLKEAEDRGLDYMGKYKEGMTPRQIAYMLTGYYQKNDAMGEIKTLKPYLDGFVRTNDQNIVKYDVELYFMQAVADLVLQKYEESAQGFKYILDEFPDSHQDANCTYWYGMSQLFLQKYVDALPNFERYIKKFPEEQFVDECYFQGGICLFGQEKYKEALERFSYVISTYPDSSVFPEACSMRGDINGSEGLLDEAIADYEMAYTASKKVTQATYATFQAAEVYEAEEKYDDIIRIVERYESRWGEEGGDIAKALFWIGKTKIQQKLYEEAVTTYVDAIVEYGGNLRQDGVDLMIAELVKIAAIYLDTEMQDKLLADLETAKEEAENETLQLRLRVLVAQLTNTELVLGQQLLAELKDFENASPPVLATICDASFEIEDYSRAEEMLRIFINKFEDSEYMRAAYKLRGFGQYTAKDYEGTIATINDAQALYGTEYDVAWAQLLKAKVLLDDGNIDEARKENMSILTVPSWRGEPVAQATFQLGEVEETAGNLAKAFAFYQRAYFQYKGHAGGHWAAEGYLASARILEKMERENDKRNTYRAMLFDPYVNSLPQADKAKEVLGATEVAEIQALIDAGTTTNISITVETEMTVDAEKNDGEAEKDSSVPTAETSDTEEGA
jgi:TolA-binding protein